MARVTKLDAASRQLDAAIHLLFSSGEPLAVHALAVSAANLYGDLAQHAVGVKSWRERMREDHGMSLGALKAQIHRTWNFLKHADRDPASVLEFNPLETDSIIFFATLECGELTVTSTGMQVFQLWFLATGQVSLDAGNEIQRFSKTLFQDLHSMTREQQLNAGLRMLELQLSAESQ